MMWLLLNKYLHTRIAPSSHNNMHHQPGLTWGLWLVFSDYNSGHIWISEIFLKIKSNTDQLNNQIKAWNQGYESKNSPESK